MSILIRGMKMPKGCYYCRFVEYFTVGCMAKPEVDIDRDDWYSMRATGCPLVELPEKHNRLLDERKVIWAFNDAILDEAKETGKCRATWNEVYGIVKTVPTVLEAEGEE